MKNKKEDLEKYGIPPYKQNKPFDIIGNKDWQKVFLDEPDPVENDIVIVKNENAEVHFSKEKGGTIRKVFFGGIDTGAKRAGCEYWSEGSDHYEQEYGKVLSFKKTEHDDFIRVEVTATLVSPQLKSIGGKCESITEIYSTGKIRSLCRMFPDKKCNNYDQYYCFENGIYSEYNFHGNGKSLNKIGEPPQGELWWMDLPNNKYTGIIIKSPVIAVSVKVDNKLTDETGIHTSRSMLELKCKDFNPARVTEFCEMVLEKV